MENERASVGGQHPAERRRRRPTALVAAACILLAPGAGHRRVRALRQPAAGPEPCLPLRRHPAPAGGLPLTQAGVVSQAAAEYERRRPVADNRCVDVRVKSTHSVEAAAALSTWLGRSPRMAPIPTSGYRFSLGLGAPGRRRQQATSQPVLAQISRTPKAATTPMVMAMPRPMAQALGFLPQQNLGFKDLLGAVTYAEGWGKGPAIRSGGPSGSARPTPTCRRPGWRR